MVNHLLEKQATLFLPLLCASVALWLTRLPFSVLISKFRIPQVLRLPLSCPERSRGIRKHRGYRSILPILVHPERSVRWAPPHAIQAARNRVLSSVLLPPLQTRKRAGNDRAHP